MSSIYPPDILIKTLKQMSPHLIDLLDGLLDDGDDTEEVCEFLQTCEGSQVVLDAACAYVRSRKGKES
jgi:hypothetical protein